MRRILMAFLLVLTLFPAARAQRPDLSGITFCIDPGHGGHSSDDRHLIPDPGVDFWESESNFQKALWLRAMLVADGATVILTRTSNDTTYVVNGVSDDEPSLAARVQTANDYHADWFHSIHSNAVADAFQTSTNYTLMLIREKRPGGIASGSGNGLGVPEYPEDQTMSNVIGPLLKSFSRTTTTSTWLDWTFYGGANGGFSLGVLRGLTMPGELSEGSFHDNLPNCRRLMNNDFRKMEAYAIRNGFRQYFGAPADTLGIIAGIQSDIVNGAALNYTQVRLLPENRVYSGDSFKNGFYLFDHISFGQHKVRFETPGRMLDSVVIQVNSSSPVFVDRSLQLAGPPAVISFMPSNGDTLVSPTASIQVSFSKSMDTASVRTALVLSPPVDGTLSWDAALTNLKFTPAGVFSFFTQYSCTVQSTAKALSGENLASPFVLGFRTGIVPVIVQRYPDSAAVVVAESQVISIGFNRRIDPATILTSNILVQEVGGGIVGRTFQYWETSERGAITVGLPGGFKPGATYRVKVSGIKDLAGNLLPSVITPIWPFSVSGDAP
jgi:N-acetylmuramoyl-L-alanine amidase